ncbi:2-oxo acid dehydrogenase subunit E2 [Nonomuraea sediminis]|uniref:2-oxo acid dehydrogenase subunit E2 n=1 Tax=Nonomuraea sediminis TaxID=2835864 RepID=UPI001BDC0748|nr:2-oxo acid dehydrogenase subunit E2 [Nonomuraea sediminis]
MGEIRVPKLNTNDAEYTLLEWLAEDGARVERDDPVATVETSKTVEELASPEQGILSHALAEGKACAPGQVIAWVGDRGSPQENTQAGADGPMITAPARELLDELGLDPELVRELGVKVVRRADVERLAAREGAPAAPGGQVTPGQVRSLPKHQQAVARTVALSHRTIPAGYTAIKVDVGAALQRARDVTRRARKLVGLPDLLVRAVAHLHDDFPLFFARLVDDTTAELAERAHVGVTIDLGTGLYIPVIKDASGKALEEVAEELAGFRRLAQHGGFREEHLSGGNITVTLHHDADIVMAIPIVFPGQACALALTSPQRDGDRTVAAIGLAYDHRLLNGRDVVLFLQALKERLETPESL